MPKKLLRYKGSFVTDFKAVVSLTAFCDETCTHEGAPITGVGGYVFDEDGQRRFVESWNETLRPLRERGIEFFHAADCYRRQNEFSVLTEPEKDRLFRELISLTRKTAKFPKFSSGQISVRIFQLFVLIAVPQLTLHASIAALIPTL